MQTQSVVPVGTFMPKALKSYLSGFYLWCLFHGYALMHVMTSMPINEEQLETLFDEYVKQSLQTDNL